MKFEYGTVERIDDVSLRAGRMKVRVDGIHSPSKQELPTDDLPWAQPVHPITSAAFKGIGYGGVGVQEGTRVLIVFRDPGQFQQPIVLGTLPGLYEGDEESVISNSRESDLGRLATANLTDKTIVQTKKDSRLELSTGYVNITEPDNPYATEYPFNQTLTSKSGHVIEIDDTPEHERIHIYHKTGSFIEIHPDGKVVYKTPSDTYEITEKDRVEYTGQNKTEYIGGAETCETIGSATFHIGVDRSITVDGNSQVNIGGNALIKVGGNVSYSVGGNFNVSVSGEYTVRASRINLN